MTQEDYVSFEIAKLLKEKGFDSEEVGYHGGFYSERCYQRGYGVKTQSGQEVGIVYDDLTNSDLDYDEYLRPTLQMAMKWLREVHHIFISIQMHLDGSYVWYLYRTDQTPQGCDRESHNHSYEQACGAAIKFCLEHIV